MNKYFSRSEFKCFCCDFDVVDAELLQVLTDLREHFNSPITINSGARCVQHNIKVGGTPLTSQHLTGKAADIVMHNVSEVLVHDYLCNKYPDKYGIGFYTGRTHIDVRSTRARWIA
tara:strand:- start:11407 stop:11754 length:348 start_codon:yes stop_codon:yes gene_type:complete